MSCFEPAEGRRISEHDYYIDLPAWGEREPFQDPRDSEEYWESMGYFDRED